MTKKIMLIIIAFVVIAAALGGIYYASRSFHLIEMESVTFSWGEVTEETTSLNAEIDVRSYLPVVMIPGVINIEMPVYLYDVEAVRFEIPEFKLSGRQTTLHASAVIEQTNFPHWWVNFIQHEEVISLSVTP
jgi:LEA14-like dessication related protein